MGLLSSIFGGGLRKALQEGASVIDIRLAAEFDGGHVPGAHNIPVDRISISLQRIRGMGKVIICGAGDSRNTQAVEQLRKNGMKAVTDGGTWERVYRTWKNS